MSATCVASSRPVARIQRLVCEVYNAYGGREEMACTKALVERRGIPCGEPWEPLLPLSDDEKAKLYERIDAFNLDFDALSRGAQTPGCHARTALPTYGTGGRAIVPPTGCGCRRPVARLLTCRNCVRPKATQSVSPMHTRGCGRRKNFFTLPTHLQLSKTVAVVRPITPGPRIATRPRLSRPLLWIRD